MNKKYISPFKPRKIKDINTSGFNIYTFNSGYKKFKEDLLVIVFEKPVEFSNPKLGGAFLNNQYLNNQDLEQYNAPVEFNNNLVIQKLMVVVYLDIMIAN